MSNEYFRFRPRKTVHISSAGGKHTLCGKNKRINVEYLDKDDPEVEGNICLNCLEKRRLKDGN